MTQKRSPATAGLFLLVEINFNFHIPHADILNTPRIPEDVLHNFGGGLY